MFILEIGEGRYETLVNHVCIGKVVYGHKGVYIRSPSWYRERSLW